MLLVSALMISFFILVFSELRRKAGGLVNVESADVIARRIAGTGSNNLMIARGIIGRNQNRVLTEKTPK